MIKKTLILLLILLVAISACRPQTQKITGKTTSDNPSLSISGGTLNDTSALSTSNGTSTSPKNETITVGDSKTIVKQVKEGDLVSFNNLKATDPDGDVLKFTYSSPLDSKGTWQTKRGDAGTYKITISASDGTNTVSQDVSLIVESINNRPTISLAAKSITVAAGQDVSLAPKVSDEDGDKVQVSFSGWMTSDKKTTTKSDVGTHEVTISATDGQDTVSQVVKITVEAVNHAPQLDSMEDTTVFEGEKVVIVPTATDADGDRLTYQFGTPLDQNGVWQTKEGQSGKYKVEVTASDGQLNDSTSFDIIVKKRNMPPTLSLDNTLTVNEGETVTIAYKVNDPEDDEVNVVISGWMTSTSKTTTYDDAGKHTVTVTADDGTNKVSKDVTITVTNVNRAPIFDKNSFD